MEYRTHKPVPIHETAKILEKFQRQSEQVKTDKKKGSSVDI